MAGIKNEDEKRRVMEEVIDGCIEDGILSKFLKGEKK